MKNMKLALKMIYLGFVPINKNSPYCPITIYRNLNNNIKRNLYKIIRNENYLYYYDKNKFTELVKGTFKKTEYL